MPAIQAIADKEHRVGLSAEHNACPPLLGVTRSSIRGCQEFNDAALRAALLDNIKEVILVSRWAINSEGTRYGNEPGYDALLTDAQTTHPSFAENHSVFARGLEATVQRLRAAGKKVVLVESTPEIGWNVPEMLARIKLLRADLDIAPTLNDYMKRQAFVFATVGTLQKRYGITVVEPHKVLCATGRCRVELDGKPLYSDDHHVTTFGAMRLVPLLAPVL